ncbi:hypothetical protein DOY81_008010, partial [Sarcophaga bullata]
MILTHTHTNLCDLIYPLIEPDYKQFVFRICEEDFLQPAVDCL